MYSFKFLFLCLFVTQHPSISQQKEFSQLKTYRGGRIIGGSEAQAAQFPFIAAINVQTSTSTFFCGGSLITNQWVLTAGQCVNGATLFTVHLGSTLLTGEDSNRMTIATSEYVVHPDFNSQTLENDIGLIHLRMSIRFTDYIQSVYLPYKDLADSWGGPVIGWGQTNDTDSGYSNELQYVTVYKLMDVLCEETYGGQIKAGMMCASGMFNEGTCIGDVGGPLIEYNNASNTAWHTGIASFQSGNGCESTDPSGFTKTFFYREWLRNVTNI